MEVLLLQETINLFLFVDGLPIDNSTSSSLEVASTNRASDINPEDIESISVLKGPAAAALYGIQAAEGAVIITTKKGKACVTHRLLILDHYQLIMFWELQSIQQYIWARRSKLLATPTRITTINPESQFILGKSNFPWF